MDIATQKNLDHLVKVGEGLLKKPVSRVNLDTGLFEPSSKETNAEALIRYVRVYIYIHFLTIYLEKLISLLMETLLCSCRFAKILSQERLLRLARSPHGHAANSK